MDFFHLTATWGLNRRGVHPKIWALFFLGGHCQELFFQPLLDFYYECKEGRWVFPPDSNIGAQQGRGAPYNLGAIFPWWELAKRIF